MNPVEAVEAVLALVNTRPLERRPDGLNCWTDLGLLGSTSGSVDFVPGTTSILEAVEIRRLREALAAVVLASTPSEAQRQLQHLTATYSRTAQSTEDDRSPVADLAAALVLPLAQAIAHGVLQRVGVCPDGSCQRVFLGHPLGRPRRYCSSRCSTRVHMRELRRQHPSASPKRGLLL